MKFRDVRTETRSTVELVCLILSLGAIFFQIWILFSSWEAFFEGKIHRILPAVILSFIFFSVCALTAWTTGMSFIKGKDEGRTKTYHKFNIFRKN